MVKSKKNRIESALRNNIGTNSAETQWRYVPYLPTEWNTVKMAFQKPSSETCPDALETLTGWRIKSSAPLSFGIQASEVLTRAVLSDPVFLGGTELKSNADRENLRLIYGMAVTRFVNYVADLAGTTLSIRDACRMYEIPLWVVAIRHAATHRNLPKLAALREAIRFCWNWLLANYWEVETPYKISPETTSGDANRSNNGLAVQTEDQTDTSSFCSWTLADDTINWTDLPIGLGPGQRVEDLDLRVLRNHSGGGNETTGSGTSQGQSTVPAPSNIEEDESPSRTVEWSDEKRLELIQGLVQVLGE